MIAWTSELCSTPSDAEIDTLRDIRRQASRDEAGEEVKELRKFHQRRIKAATILIEYFTATGKFVARSSNAIFPEELRPEMRSLFASMQDARFPKQEGAKK